MLEVDAFAIDLYNPRKQFHGLHPNHILEDELLERVLFFFLLGFLGEEGALHDFLEHSFLQKMQSDPQIFL